MSILSTKSGMGFSSHGKTYQYDGVPLYGALVISPLVEVCGSGGSPTHPEGVRTFAYRTIKSETYADSRFPEGSTAGLTTLPTGTRVAEGDVMVWRPNPLFTDGKEPLLTWDDLCLGIVAGAATVTISAVTGNVRVAIEMLGLSTSANCEKFRGSGKWTGDGGFNRNITVVTTTGRKVVYDPSRPLYRANGNLAQVEHVLGMEEAKTLNWVINMVGHKMPGGVAVYRDGRWENEEQLKALVAEHITRVDVTIWGVEQSIYDMLHTLHGHLTEFEFTPATNTIVHRGAHAYIGEQTHIVEVPLTVTFAGRSSLYYEHLESMRVVLPELVNELDKSVARNRKLVDEVLNAVRNDGPQSMAWVTAQDTYVEVSEGRAHIEIVPHPVLGHVVRHLVLPGYIDNKVFGALQKQLETLGFKGMGFYAAGVEEEYFTRLNLRMFGALSGANSTVGYRKLTSIFALLSVTRDEEGNPQRVNSYEQDYIRCVAGLRGVMEQMIADSSALFARATKTGEIAVSMRARASIFIQQTAVHINPRTAEYFGIQQGDYLVAGRVPMPGVGVLRAVLDATAPEWVFFMHPGMKHQIEEGDVDGDQTLFIVVNATTGELHTPRPGVRRVSTVAAD